MRHTHTHHFHCLYPETLIGVCHVILPHLVRMKATAEERVRQRESEEVRKEAPQMKEGAPNLLRRRVFCDVEEAIEIDLSKGSQRREIIPWVAYVIGRARG